LSFEEHTDDAWHQLRRFPHAQRCIRIDGKPGSEKVNVPVMSSLLPSNPSSIMFSVLESAMNSSLTAYGTEYTSTRDTYLAAAKALKEATGPYKATRDAYVAATATYTKSLYE
jgi:hypothetical protein